MSVVLYLILAALALTFLWVQKRFSFWADRGFKSPKSIFPFGSLKGVGTKRTWYEATDAIYREFKGKEVVVGFYSFLSPSILVIDPEVFKNILVKDFNSFHDRGFYYNKDEDPLTAK
jgi:cytochrome P450 family 6